MKLHHLRFFIAVVECGGIIKAAQRMHISQPALSAGIKQLEQELGAPLFERRAGRRGVIPTMRALVFYKRATEILAQCEAARAAFQNDDEEPPELRIGVIPTLHRSQVANFVQSLASTRHSWRIRLVEGSPPKLQSLLRAGRLDAAWTNLNGGPEAHVLGRERFAIFASRNHTLVHRPAETFSVVDLNGQPFILRVNCELPPGQMRAAGLLVKVVAKAERDELAFALAAQGVGLVLAPRSLASSAVMELPLRDLQLTRTLGFQWAEATPAKVREAIVEASSSLRSVERALPAQSWPGPNLEHLVG